MPRFPFSARVVYRAVREVRRGVAETGPLVVAGAPHMAAELRRALTEGGDAGAVRDATARPLSDDDLDRASALVYVIEGERATPADEQALRRAERAGVPTVCLLVGPRAGDVPYVLPTDVLSVPSSAPLPLERVAERLAERAEERAYALAARLPALRQPVVRDLVRRVSRQNAVLGAAIFIPGADMPVLTLNQIRMVLRIAVAYGEEIDRERALELLAVVGAGFGFRAAARQALAFVPVAGWAVKGGVAYAGTRAVGRAAISYFEKGGSGQVAAAVRRGS